MANFAQTLRSMYLAADQDRLLTDADYFLSELTCWYQPEFKEDCKLLQRAAKSGVGQIMMQYIRQGQRMTAADRPAFQQALQHRSGFTAAEAQRITSLYTAMLGWTAPRWTNPGSSPRTQSVTERMKSAFSPNGQTTRSPFATLSLLHLALCVVYTGVLIYLYVTGAQHGNYAVNPLDIIGDFLVNSTLSYLMKYHVLLIILGDIFSIVGIFTKQTWPYMGAAIAEVVALAVGLKLLIFLPWLLLMAVPLVFLGFFAFAKGRELNR